MLRYFSWCYGSSSQNFETESVRQENMTLYVFQMENILIRTVKPLNDV